MLSLFGFRYLTSCHFINENTYFQQKVQIYDEYIFLILSFSRAFPAQGRRERYRKQNAPSPTRSATLRVFDKRGGRMLSLPFASI
jgi:hypothetical protein